MTQLERLGLIDCTPACGAAGAAELLSRLSQLTVLHELFFKYVKGLQECPLSAFSSLTTSSMLESLTWDMWTPAWNQPGPWQHMFPDKLQMSMLTELDVLYTMPWEAPDLDRLVSSCSHLRSLSLRFSSDLDLTALLQLTALTRFWWRDASETSTIGSLVQLSALQGLQELAVLEACSLTDDCVVRMLTALTQLTRLGLSKGDVSVDMEQQLLQQSGQQRYDELGVMCHIIINTASAGAPPNVWSQLLSCCEACALATQQQLEGWEEEEEEEEEVASPPASPALPH